jgi:acetoin utilization deacetylase AcuC-like enzyme/RimJ/RimL family protein N-acetyltransferase
MPLALIYDRRCLAHDNGSMLLDPRASGWLDVGHAEGPERIARSWELLQSAGPAASLERLPLRPASRAELELVHPGDHVDRVQAECERGELAWVGPEARVGPASWEPILLAAGAAAVGVEWTARAPGNRAFALIRPPGHHASAEQAMGFCIFNNAAIAARVAQRDHGRRRVAIVDWDVHHGNGTETIFYSDPDVLFCSLHQDGLYPADRGSIDDAGSGAGEGTTVNVPLPAGTGDAGYALAMEQVVVPALRRFEPELLIVSAGQDPSAADPLGRMSVTADGFRAISARLGAAAAELCEGRMLVLQEGGYSPDHLPFCNLGIVEGFAGLEPTFDSDPLEMDVPSGTRAIERGAIAAAARRWAQGPRPTWAVAETGSTGAAFELRPLAIGDEDELIRIHRTPEVSRWWDQPADGFPWEEPESTRFVIEVEGRVVGLIQFSEEHEPKYRQASIDLFLDPDLHGRGIGSAAVGRLASELFERRRHHRITIDPAAANAAAIRAYEKAGFRRVGVLRSAERDGDGRGWHDSVMMELVGDERAHSGGE